jgi:hypothetical protein
VPTGRSAGRRVRWVLVPPTRTSYGLSTRTFALLAVTSGATRSLLQWCARRGARAAESDSLLMSWLGKLGPRVQIPPSPHHQSSPACHLFTGSGAWRLPALVGRRGLSTWGRSGVRGAGHRSRAPDSTVASDRRPAPHADTEGDTRRGRRPSRPPTDAKDDAAGTPAPHRPVGSTGGLRPRLLAGPAPAPNCGQVSCLARARFCPRFAPPPEEAANSGPSPPRRA